MKAGPDKVAGTSTQGTIVGLADRGGQGRCRIGLWIQPLIYAVWARVRIHSLHFVGITAKTGSSGDRTGNCSGLPILKGQNPVGAPSPEESVNDTTCVIQIFATSANWKVVSPAQVKDFVYVEIAKPIVPANSEAGQVRGTVGSDGGGVEHVNCVGQTTGPGKVRQNTQASAETVLVVRL